MTFEEWFYSKPHRHKYAKGSPAYECAKEAWRYWTKQDQCDDCDKQLAEKAAQK